MQISTDGLIIMEQSIGEDDRLVAVLTRSEGLIRAFVKGAKRIKNKNSASTQLLSYSRLGLYKGRDKYIIHEAEAKEIFFKLRADIEKLALAQYFCELVLSADPEGSCGEEFLRVILNALYYLSEGKISAKILKAIVEVRVLSLAGYMPDLVCCKKCLVYSADKMYFSPRRGILLCEKCLGGAKPGALPVSSGALMALRHAVYADIKKLFFFKISEQSLLQFSNAAEKYVLARLEKKFKTLDFYHAVAKDFVSALADESARG